jgi:predicted TIM-barrel fold metal-dependent hydrolase
VFDAHTHIRLGSAETAARIFEQNGIEVAANLTGRPFGRLLMAYLEEARAVSLHHSGVEILVLAGIDWRHLDEPDFGMLAADNLRRAFAAGARGLKVFKSLGLGIRDQDGRLLHVDDERLDPVWATAGELRMPVAIHTGDPLAFFKPPTPDNERYAELASHPDWSFYGGDYPSLEELMAARDRLVARHPKTIFVAVHFGGFPENIDAVAGSMRAHPNLWIDLAARIPEIGRHDPERMHRFFVEFQDRIVFGTDIQISNDNVVLGSAGIEEHHLPVEARAYYDVHWRYLETRDRGMSHVTPIQGQWTIDAIGLPRAILTKVYRDNARRLYQLD